MKTILVAALAAAFAAPVFAQSTPRIDKRQELQDRRIEQGKQSGALNEREAARLERGQARVQKMEDKAAADGRIGARERARIEHAQDKQSRRIARQKHDRQRAK